MPVVQFPSVTPTPQLVSCTLCPLTITPTKATLGMFDAHSEQQFACNSHFWEHGWFFLDAWISFMTDERMKLLIAQRHKPRNNYEWEPLDNAWSLH